MPEMREISLDSAELQIATVFDGSDAGATRSLYADLEAIGPAGKLSANLLRAQKASSRAKMYHGGSYRAMAYNRKQWAIGQVISTLKDHPELCNSWGWKMDPSCFVPWVFYMEIPPGQVSFHCYQRGEGPDFSGEWDGVKGVSPSRIVKYSALVLSGQLPGTPPGSGNPSNEEEASCQEQLALAL